MDFDILNETITPLNTTVLTLGSTGAVGLPSGTTAQRPIAVAGAMRWNTTIPQLEYYTGSVWTTFSAGSGSVTSVGLALPSIFTVTGSPVTTSGTLTATLAAQAANTIFAGPSTGSASPTFRALALATNDLNDVVITSATTGQVLTYNGADWVNSNATASAATGNVGVTPTANGTAWSLVSGSVYTATFTHNLATTDLSITCYDVLDSSVVIPHYITTPTSNTIVIHVYGNTKTLKIVAVANGLSISAGGSTPSSVITQLNGSLVSAAANTLNFTGQAVSLTAASTTTTINVGSRFTYYANSLDSPNTSDFAVNALAPVVTDPTYTSMVVRSFSNTTEQGVSTLLSVPLGATNITFRIRGRAQTTPGAASNVQPRIYSRLLPNNSAVGAWAAGTNLSTIAIPTNAYFQYYVYTVTLSSLGLAAGNLYQLELTRYNTGVTSNLASNFYLAEMTLEIS
jgi:hypothetical protein